MLGNKHIVIIHATIKKECEQLADLVVSLAKDVPSRRLTWRPGQGQVMGKSHDAKVSFIVILFNNYLSITGLKSKLLIVTKTQVVLKSII